MPCYRCGVRQTDPSRGQSPWKRGVRRYSQILICPGCQDTADWVAELDRCSQCSSVHLVKRLGEVECRDCGAIVPPQSSGEPGHLGPADEGPARAVGRQARAWACRARAVRARETRAWETTARETWARVTRGWRVRGAVLTCPRKSPGPWTGCWAGAWSARACSARRIRQTSPLRARAGPRMPRPGITRRLILGRSATARPGQVRPGRVPAAWMRSGLVRSLGEQAGLALGRGGGERARLSRRRPGGS